MESRYGSVRNLSTGIYEIIGSRLFAASSVFLLAAISSPGGPKRNHAPRKRGDAAGGIARDDFFRWTRGSGKWEARNLQPMRNWAALVFDRLVTLDNYGRFRPQLANRVSHDSGFRKWQFYIAARREILGRFAPQCGRRCRALGRCFQWPANICIRQQHNHSVGTAMPDLLEELASGRYFVYRVQPDGTLMGTGPFFAAGSSPATGGASDSSNSSGDSPRTAAARAAAKPAHLRFRANEETWSGRPFLDAIEVTLGSAAAAAFRFAIRQSGLGGIVSGFGASRHAGESARVDFVGRDIVWVAV